MKWLWRIQLFMYISHMGSMLSEVLLGSSWNHSGATILKEVHVLDNGSGLWTHFERRLLTISPRIGPNWPNVSRGYVENVRFVTDAK